MSTLETVETVGAMPFVSPSGEESETEDIVIILPPPAPPGTTSL